MFSDAISKVIGFTRPIKFISRAYNSQDIIPGLATLFFINDEGCALTCKHVAQQLIISEQINRKHHDYFQELNEVKRNNPYNLKKEIKRLEAKYQIKRGELANMKCQFNETPDFKAFDITLHPDFDLALIQFKDYNKLHYKTENIFLLKDEDELKQGKSLCRLGFPFPEFNNFIYNQENDDINWTGEPVATPCFPIDGILTRFIAEKDKGIFGIELSTPGLRGQSGGPLFDTEGRICGMQYATHHLHLGFDIDGKININGQEKEVKNQPFLHVGQCIHIKVIKEFLDNKGIKYNMK